MVSVALFLENQNETKHVESELVPRLDEGSNPSSSTLWQKRPSEPVSSGGFFVKNIRIVRVICYVLNVSRW